MGLLTISLEPAIEQALKHKEYYSLALIIDNIASEYFEGEIASSGLKLKAVLKQLPEEALRIYLLETVYCFVVKEFIKRHVPNQLQYV